jgi:hypothetical protein
MSKDVKLIAEAYKSIYNESHDLMNDLVSAITAGSTMLGGATSSDADSLATRTITKIANYVKGGGLDKRMLFKTLVRARRENTSALKALIGAGERATYEGKETFLKDILPIARKVLTADVNELREMEAADDAKDYLLKKVDQS